MHTAVIGTQWGDEGKGKIVDLIAKDYDVIVRCQGGNNAGHTVVLNNEKFAFHLLPSAILHPDKICVLGNGMVIDPNFLFDELKKLELKIGNKHARLFISNRAHAITPENIKIDLEKGGKVGTTGKGIGPTYSNKINRIGLRFHDLENMNFCSEECINALSLMVIDTSVFLSKSLDDGKKILFEGAQATMLDIDHGTYPFVTTSNCSIGGIFTGSGIFVRDLEIIGVVKAYTTRVGNGPFVTELFDEIGKKIREKGGEYGTTTGRPRRCGWLDTIVIRYSKRINNLDCVALTKLDVLTGLKELNICDSYNNGEIREFPAIIKTLDKAKPDYISMPGWSEDISKCKTFRELPINAQNYIRKIEELTGVKVKYIGVGADRSSIIIREK